MASNHSKIGALAPLVGYHLRRASGAFAVDFNAAMDGTGMRQALFAILAVVQDSPGINQGAVGTILGVKRANMVSLINELVDKGLIDRDVDPADRRAFALKLTGKGEAMLSDCLDRIDQHEQRMLSSFSNGEKAMLLELLARIERQPVGAG